MQASSSASLMTISPGLAAPAAPLTRGGKAAREFEAQLLENLLGPLEKTFASIPGGNTTGEDNYNYLGTHALASALAAAGGLGIGALIKHDLSAHESRK